MTGIGSLWLNGTEILAKVQYQLSERTLSASALGRTSGRLLIDLPTGLRLMATIPVGPGDDLVLRLADGRKWHCNLLDSNGMLNNCAGFSD